MFFRKVILEVSIEDWRDCKPGLLLGAAREI